MGSPCGSIADAAMKRIVSLLPSLTETVYALGCGEQLVGRSHECDLPPEAQRLPVCTEPKLDPSAPSRAIDERVKAIVREGLSVYRVDAERLRTLRPDVILTQEQCEVCAVTPRDLDAAVSEWIGSRPQVVSVEPETLGDVLDDLVRVAEELGVPDRGRSLRDALSARTEAITRQAPGGEGLRVACLEWIDPLMGAGNWVPELVERAGGRNLFGEAGGHSPWISFDALREADPEVIVILPCGFGLERTRAELQPLAETPGFRGLRAVREGRVFLVDGNRHLNRPGPRIVESLEILAEMLHPDRFRFGHESVGWERLAASAP